MTVTEWTLEIVAPCEWINTNGRDHWRVRNQRTQLWRNAARTYARQAKLPRSRIPHIAIEALLHFRDNRRRDAHNYMPTLKAIVDGLVDHGLIRDDSTGHLTGPDIRMGEVRELTRVGAYSPCGLVALTIREVT
jgi:crossover junction endodeoxyribonuclease RusA